MLKAMSLDVWQLVGYLETQAQFALRYPRKLGPLAESQAFLQITVSTLTETSLKQQIFGFEENGKDNYVV